jgi:hypothetical protein
MVIRGVLHRKDLTVIFTFIRCSCRWTYPGFDPLLKQEIFLLALGPTSLLFCVTVCKTALASG